MLADTSAWVDHLRGRRTKAAGRLSGLLGDGLATTDIVVMELLMGARDDAHLRVLQGLVDSCDYLPTHREDYESAAAIWRSCRRAGVTVRSIPDLLVAAVAIRVDVAVLHNDRDFEVIARHVDLRIDR